MQSSRVSEDQMRLMRMRKMANGEARDGLWRTGTKTAALQSPVGCNAAVCFIHSIISSVVPDSGVGRLVVHPIFVVIDVVEFEVFLIVALWLNVHNIASLIVYHIGAPFPDFS